MTPLTRVLLLTLALPAPGFAQTSAPAGLENLVTDGVPPIPARIADAAHRYGDFRRGSPRFQGTNFEKNLDLVRKVEEIAREKRSTPAQLALAWLLARGEDIVPIPGTKRRARLEENAQAVGIALSKSDLARIDAVAPKGVAAGARYAETGMQLLDR